MTDATRRVVWSFLVLSPLLACSPLPRTATGDESGASTDSFTHIEARTGGRIGVAALDMETGRMLGHRLDERFAMCSTFKWLLAGLILQRVEQGEEQLNRRISYTADDLVSYSPVTENAVDEGMIVSELCAATVGTSDNTAANLLIASLGGPSGVTARIRALGDAVTRLDRLEPQLNENAPGDPRDTSTPAAMIQTMRRVLFGDVLTRPSRRVLQRWMIEASTGLDRLRAGLPEGWIAGDKTGTSSNYQNNDVAFALPPPGRDRGPIIIVSYLNIAKPINTESDALHAEIARVVSREFGLG